MSRKLNSILLIDDDKATNFLNRRLLAKMDVADEINVARNGLEALEILRKAANNEPGYLWPELVLLDINMPLVDGWEFLDKYEELPESIRKSTIILMLTTSLRDEDDLRAKGLHSVRGYINKPLTQTDLEKIIARHFSENPIPD